MPLPQLWIDRIWARLLVRYGVAWLRMYPQDEETLLAVKSDWAKELGNFSSDTLAYALDNLPPDHPPNVTQFRALCIRRPEPMPKALPAPLADPARVEEAMSKLKRYQDNSPKAWDYRLKEREESGERLTKAQGDMWRAALKPRIADDQEAA